MTDYTDLKARLRAETGRILGPVGEPTEEPVELYGLSLAVITALEADIARLQTAHVQMQRAHDDLAAENARLRGALTRQGDNMAFVINHASLADQWVEKFTRELAEDRADLTAPTSG